MDENPTFDQPILRKFFYGFHGLSGKLAHNERKKLFEAETENLAFSQARHYAGRLAGKWGCAVEVISNGKAIDFINP